MPQVVSQVQFKRSDKTLANLSTQKLKYGEPIVLVNASNRALVIGNTSENDTLASDYFIPLASKDVFDKGYMVKGVDYVTAGKKSGTNLGTSATAEGVDVTATGTYAHAEGYNTTANHKSQHVFGEYNVADTNASAATAKGNYVEIVGNGTADNSRSNARTLDWNGNETLAGKLTVGAQPTNNMDVTTKQYVDTAVEGTTKGTVTSVQVQASSPVVSSVNTQQTTALNTTISLADGYGDTKNPYATKTKNFVLASPSNASGTPSFRALDATDIPSLDTSKLTSGTLGVARGGTGLTASPSMLTNLASTSAANVMAASPRPGVTGTLPVGNGGTGQTTFTANALLKGNGTGAVANGPVIGSSTTTFLRNDGTWQVPPNTTTGTTYAAASVPNNTTFSTQGSVYNVYNATKHTTATVSLAAGSWNANNQQTVTVSGVTASNLIQVSPAPATWTSAYECGIYCSAQAANSLTFTCMSKPTVAITMNIVIFS